jgi:hypothetical protein
MVILLAWAAIVATSVGAALFTLDASHHIYLSRSNLPDLGRSRDSNSPPSAMSTMPTASR